MGLALGLASTARAEIDLFSRDTVSGLLDLRLGASNGEPSWVDGGLGKTRIDGARQGVAVRPELADADLVWSPSIGDVTGVFDIEAQPRLHSAVDLAQAYLLYKPAPTSPTHVAVRAGLFYPPISLEHEGYSGGPWTVTNTITPSAINAWVGQELKVVGVEPSIWTTLGGHELGLTAALFGFDDTAGTLLALRGWTLDDVKGGAFGRLALPPLDPFLEVRQAAYTEPLRELDGKLGYYLRADWRPPAPFSANAVYYDNRGDRTSDDHLQWAWATHFWNVGAEYDPAGQTRLLAQAMTGETRMGFLRGATDWVDVDFSSAYLLLSQRLGDTTLSGRVDGFATRDRQGLNDDGYGEHGWALTADYRVALRPNLTFLLEALHVESRRPQREYLGQDPRATQTTLQAALRVAF